MFCHFIVVRKRPNLHKLTQHPASVQFPLAPEVALLLWVNFLLNGKFFLELRGIAFQASTSCLGSPGRLRAPRRVHAPDFPVKAYALAFLQERSGSIPLSSCGGFTIAGDFTC